MAEAVNATDHDIKLLENGVLPANDFVLISALERYCGISLRKDPASNPPPLAELRSARSVLEGGSVPRFGGEREPASSSGKRSEKREKDFLQSEDLLDDNFDSENASKAL